MTKERVARLNASVRGGQETDRHARALESACFSACGKKAVVSAQAGDREAARAQVLARVRARVRALVRVFVQSLRSRGLVRSRVACRSVATSLRRLAAMPGGGGGASGEHVCRRLSSSAKSSSIVIDSSSVRDASGCSRAQGSGGSLGEEGAIQGSKSQNSRCVHVRAACRTHLGEWAREHAHEDADVARRRELARVGAVVLLELVQLRAWKRAWCERGLGARLTRTPPP
eukprot:4754993-Pleurochrysis_carterae.AAC.5